MGWTYCYHQVHDVKRHLENNEGLFTSSLPGHDYRVLDSAIVGNTYYAAVRRTTPERPDGYVFAAIVLFRNPKSGFGYKDMDESCGPCEVSCPLRILDKLTPIDQMPGGMERYSYAAHWREQVREFHRKKLGQNKSSKALRVGDKVKLAKAVRFTSGFEEDTFTVVNVLRRGRNCRLYQSTSGSLCRVPAHLLEGATQIAA